MSDFQQNLRLLTNHFKSVAEVCRRLDINRSQFNKYLGGTTRPSPNALAKICDFFGVEESEIMLPHEDFENLIRLRRKAVAGPLAYSAYLDQITRQSRSDLDEYDGYYHEYSYCMTVPGSVMRTLVKITSEDGVTRYSRIENLAYKSKGEPRAHGRYNGLAFYLNDRIFLVDFDALTGEEISQTILYPTYRRGHNRLPGLKLGLSTSNTREPLCARVLYRWLGKEVNLKEALSACSLFKPDDPEIDRSIEQTIRNVMIDGDHHFRVRSGL